MQQVLRTLTDFERDGFAVFRAVVPAQQIEQLTDIVEKARTEQAAPGLRKVRIASADPGACLTQRVFYKLRRALIQNYRLERHNIAPDTRLTDLLPLNVIEDGWPFLQMFIDLKTPPFKVANEILRFRLSEESLTMRQLVESLIMINGRALAPQRDSEEEIWHRLVRVFVRQTNVRAEQVKPEASITRDLGID